MSTICRRALTGNFRRSKSQSGLILEKEKSNMGRTLMKRLTSTIGDKRRETVHKRGYSMARLGSIFH